MISNLPSYQIVSYGSEASPHVAKAASLPQVGADLETEEQTFVRRPTVKIADTQSFEQLKTLTPEQRQQLLELQRQKGDEVRNQQPGRFSGAKSFHSQFGADGHHYVTAGWRPLELSPVPNDPAGTVAKMRAVRRAALTPLESGDIDRKMAMNADRAIRSAQSNILEAELNRDVEASILRQRVSTRRGTVASLLRVQLAASEDNKSLNQPLAMNDDLSRLLDGPSVKAALDSYLGNEGVNLDLQREPGTLLSLVA
jgi:hypothetical protein